MNFPSPETKKPFPLALKCPVSSKTDTMTTAARIGCATSAKEFIGVCDCCGEGVAVASIGEGVVAAGEGEDSGARTSEGLRSHETNAPRTRIKPIHRIRLNDIAWWSLTQGKSAANWCHPEQ
jgi:hypothetical protein